MNPNCEMLVPFQRLYALFYPIQPALIDTRISMACKNF